MLNNVEEFIDEISQVNLRNCFNPYADRCEIYDERDAVNIRRNNLRSILSVCANLNQVDLWIGRDLGHRGGRRTGIALTDEVHLSTYSSILGLPVLEKATIGSPVKEQTASCVYQVMKTCNLPVMTWNVFPFHPFRAENEFSNRSHTKIEASVGIHFLSRLLEIIKVRRIVSIGTNATVAASGIHDNCTSVRHPSYGGKPVFLKQMENLYPIDSGRDAQLELLLM